MRRATHLFLFLALILALAGSAFFLLAPQPVVERTGESGVVILQPATLYKAQGIWGVTVAILFVGLYAAPLFFFLRHSPGWAALFGINALLLTYLGGTGLGPSYWPAALVLLLATLMLLLQKLPDWRDDLRSLTSINLLLIS